MDQNDYFGPVLALIVGILFVIYRREAAEIAMREHDSLYGRKWPQRSFEYPFLVGGVLAIVWALFVLVVRLLVARV